MSWRQTLAGEHVATWRFTASPFVRALTGVLCAATALTAVFTVASVLMGDVGVAALGTALFMAGVSLVFGACVLGWRTLAVDTARRTLSEDWGVFRTRVYGRTFALDELDHLRVARAVRRGRTSYELRLEPRQRRGFDVVNGCPQEAEVVELAQALGARTGLPVRHG